MRRSLRLCWVMPVLLLWAAGPLGLWGQEQDAAVVKAATAAPNASRAEIEELRAEVAEQRKTIEELQATVDKLIAAQRVSSSVQGDNAHLMNATLADPVAMNMDMADPVADPMDPQKNGAKPAGSGFTAGWNGEHFFIKSADGVFQIQPYGYVNADYRAFKGDGAPADTYVLRRARFGFQGNYGTSFQFAILADPAATSGSILRDVYLNAKIKPEFQVQVGQFKVPFAQEAGLGVTNLDFVERALTSMLYPDAASAYRSPGGTIHGDIDTGKVQYWIGAFNGKGFGIANTTNQPEILGRVRFYPWRSNKESVLQGLAFGGSIDYGRTRALSNEQSFGGTLPDTSYNFFPNFTVNGKIWRYNGEFTYLKGPWAVRAEYDQIQMHRDQLGSYTFGGLGFVNLPAVYGKAYYVSTTYLLTGEKRPENGTPRVRHPVLGPDTPGGGGRGWGAWELAARYSWIHANEPGINIFNVITPELVPAFDAHTDAFTAGINWYPNYWVKYQVNFEVDRLKDPSVIGIVPQNYFVLLQRLQFRF